MDSAKDFALDNMQESASCPIDEVPAINQAAKALYSATYNLAVAGLKSWKEGSCKMNDEPAKNWIGEPKQAKNPQRIAKPQPIGVLSSPHPLINFCRSGSH